MRAASTIPPANIPPEVKEVAQALEKAGYEAYLVGGCVRDLLLGKEPKDWDITTNATPEKIQRLFPHTYYNNEFGTVGVVTESGNPATEVVEVTTYRTEGTYADFRRPLEVSFTDSLEEDLARRDFTINAMAYSISRENLIDTFGGLEDLRREIIRAVGDPNQRFSEDALRMLRAIRLAAELNLAIEGETLTAIAQNAPLLEHISRERIRDEFIRIIASPSPAVGMALLRQTGLMRYVLPELEETYDVGQNRSHIYDVFEHLVRSVQHAADRNFSLAVRLAALLHDIGKPATKAYDPALGDHTFYNHEVVGAAITKRALDRLKFPHDLRDKVVALVRWHMFFSDPEKITLSAVRRIIQRVGKENIWDLLHLRMCDRIGSGKPKEQPFRLRKYTAMVEQALRDPISVSMLAINGTNLMEHFHVKSGPAIGWVLHALLEEILEDPSKNNREYLLARAQELLALPEEELRQIGEKGKKTKEEAEEAATKEILKKYGVV